MLHCCHPAELPFQVPLVPLGEQVLSAFRVW
jgi:hypothetical protein